MERCKILVPIGCRSDEGLSAPIIKRLREDDFFDVRTFILNPAIFYGSYGYSEQEIWGFRPDLVFITGDRIEMCAAACAAFHNRVPIAHYFAGVLSYPLSTLDDVNRHCISLWSDVQFVESLECRFNVDQLLYSVAKRPNVHVVGITHLENLEIDESLVPKKEYDLVLYNPTTIYREDIVNIARKRFYKNTIWIGPNPDPSFFDIKKVSETKSFWLTPKGFKPNPILFAYYDNLPRPQFLGLLKNCTRFITNSSAATYEAPYFLKKEQIITVGDRNKNRTQFEYKKSRRDKKTDKLASEKIIEILKNWWLKKNV